MFRIVGACLVAAASIVTSAHSAVFVENFDADSIDPRWGVYDTFGQFVTTAGAGIEIQRGVVTGSHSGGQHVELDSHVWSGNASSNSSMAAAVDLVGGLTYKLTFAYKPRTNQADDNGIGFSVGTLIGNSFAMTQWVGSVDGTRGEQPQWNLVSMLFTAIDGDNAIQFSALGQANTLGGLIDSIKIEEMPVPIPAAGLLLVTGLAVLRSARYKKRLTLG
ncbi:MAG: VPLPA-CTERM sorting domain-containing protein [Pseudomonadota bacterium]